MTTYTTNQRLKVIDKFIKSLPWFKGKVMGKGGTFPLPQMGELNNHVQLDTIIARAAKIKVSISEDYPNTSGSDLKNMTRTLHYFNGLIDWTESQYKAYLSGDRVQVGKTKEEIDSVEFAHDQELEEWYVGYGVDFTAKVDSSPYWIPWFNAQDTATSDINNPADMNVKVTNIAGTTGTSGTILPMTTVLTSKTTSQTIDFTSKTFQPIIRAFTSFKDAANGRRMVESKDSVKSDARYTFLGARELIEEMYDVKQFDGEKILPSSPSVAQVMESKKIDLVPCDLFTAALEEDGVCQFGMVCDFERNFKKGIEKKPTWEADKEIPDVMSKWIKKMKSRGLAFSQPYSDGTNYFKAFVHGSFVYMNDA